MMLSSLVLDSFFHAIGSAILKDASRGVSLTVIRLIIRDDAVSLIFHGLPEMIGIFLKVTRVLCIQVALELTWHHWCVDESSITEHAYRLRVICVIVPREAIFQIRIVILPFHF